jgi:hypothetical protein
MAKWLLAKYHLSAKCLSAKCLLALMSVSQISHSQMSNGQMSIGEMVFDQKTYNQQLMFVEGEKISWLQSFGITPLPLKYLILVVNTIKLFTEVNCICIGKAFCITDRYIYSTVLPSSTGASALSIMTFSLIINKL